MLMYGAFLFKPFIMKNIFSKKEVEFIEKAIPFFNERIQMMNTPDEELVGKEVISIRSGFSTLDGGQKMKIESIYHFGVNKIKQFKLVAIKESIDCSYGTGKWISQCDRKHNDFILWDRTRKYNF